MQGIGITAANIGKLHSLLVQSASALHFAPWAKVVVAGANMFLESVYLEPTLATRSLSVEPGMHKSPAIGAVPSLFIVYCEVPQVKFGPQTGTWVTVLPDISWS